MTPLSSRWARPFAGAVLACLLTQGGSDLRAIQAGPATSIGVVFTDVTTAAGIRFKHNNGAFGKTYLPETLGSGGAFIDFDDDGWQDILLVHSRSLAGRPFENVTRTAGLYDPSSKALGVALLDYDADGLPDVFVANDTHPNRLYRNNGDGTFVDVGMTAGVAFNEAGVARAGMGVDAADYDGSGRPSIIIGNFSNEMMALYSNEGNGLFIDEAPASTIGTVSLLTLTFSSYCSQRELPLTFGLGKSGRVAAVEITWPNGRSETVRDIGANRAITLIEGKGLVRSVPLGSR